MDDRAVGVLRFGVWGLGFGVWGSGFVVWGLGFGVWGLGFGVLVIIFSPEASASGHFLISGTSLL